MCSTSAGCSTGSQFSRTQSVQKVRFSATQSLASPKSGMTGSAAIYRSSSVIRSSVSTRFVPSAPSTRTARAPAFSIAESASRSVVSASRSGPTAPFAGFELELAEPRQREPLQPAVGADEPRDELVRGVRQQLLRRLVLGEDAALAQDRDPVADEDRLVDVVGDEDDRLPDLAVDPQQLLLQPGARDRIEGAERLVHQHHGRVGREGAREPDALALAAGELRGVAGAVVARGQVDEVEQLVDARGGLGLRPAEQARDGRDVLRDGHVREEAHLLDHVADPAPQLGLVQRVDALTVDADVARR